MAAATRDELLAELRAAAAPGLPDVDSATRAALEAITGRLVGLLDDRATEHERFRALRARRLGLPAGLLREAFAGRTVLLTGGTGCVGSAVAAELATMGAGRVVNLSRGVSPAWRPFSGGETLAVDVRDRAAVLGAFRQLRPDVVVHLAALRDGARAERDVRASVATNVLGTRNVLDACEAADVGRLVYASTGKALWPYTPHVYGCTKRLAEWLVGRAAQRGLPCSVVRFTHIADNSLVLPRFRRAAAGGLVRLHAADIRFYVQSATEAAQLLLLAASETSDASDSKLYAIRDLGLPIALTDVALGTIAALGLDAALYVCGYEPGYTESVYPGLYVPETAVDVSPLLSGFEAHAAVPDPILNLDRAALASGPDDAAADAFARLQAACAAGGDAGVRATLEQTARRVLEAAMAAVPDAVLRRVAELAAPHRASLAAPDRVIDDAVRRALAAGAQPVAAAA